MPSSTFVLSTIISFVLTPNLCSAYAPGQGKPQVPSGGEAPSVGGGAPSGWDCAFKPASGCGPDTTSPEYNACIVRYHSISEFIQCADRKSTTGSNDDNEKPISALDVLVSAIKIEACGKCNLGTVFSDYDPKKDESVKLAYYLCGKVDDTDICCLSGCIGTRQPEHGLKGICENKDVNLWDNEWLNCGGDSSGGDGGDVDQGGGGDSNVDNGQVAVSSTIVADSPEPTVTPSTFSGTAARTTSPTQTASSSPAGSSDSSAGPSLWAVDIITSGLLVVILTAGMAAVV